MPLGAYVYPALCHTLTPVSGGPLSLKNDAMVPMLQLFPLQVATCVVPMALVRREDSLCRSYCVDSAIGCASDIPPLRIIFSFGSHRASSWCTYGSSRILDVVVLNRRLLQGTTRMPLDPLGDPRCLYHNLPPVPFSPSSTLSGTFFPENIHAHSGLHGDPRKPQRGYQGFTRSLRRCHSHWYVVYRCCP